MTRSVPLILIAALGACAGRALTATGSASTPTPAPDVFSCIRQQIKAVSFSQDSYDEDELRVTAHKYNDQVRRPDVRFRRLVDRVAFDVNPARGDSVTTVSAQASTFVELSTDRGPTEQQENTSDMAKEAARAILERCTAKR